jgi:BNR/Asp-box repeat
MTEVLVGTKKGLFVLRGEPGGAFEIVHRAFAGNVVEFAIRDPRTGRYFASVTSGFYGPRLHFTDDLSVEEWSQAKGPAFPEDGETTLVRIWVVKPGEAEGLLYAGVDPASLFVSTDNGESWQINEPLAKEREGGDWNPGLGGLALHSICPWPGDPQRLAIGISAVGVWITEDGGQSWRTGYPGLIPRYMPEETWGKTNTLCVHNMHRAPTRPERLFMQFHGGVYRSDDEGSSWIDIGEGLPSPFGFPLVVDPTDPDSAYVIPLIGAEDRTPPGGKMRVYETRDAGTSWTPRGDGLPDEEAFLTIYRQAFGSAGEGDGLELYFGATSGSVFGSADAGKRWFEVAGRLAPVTSVRAG